jgi:D-alanyl-D-alanine carboxypeptidase
MKKYVPHSIIVLTCLALLFLAFPRHPVVSTVRTNISVQDNDGVISADAWGVFDPITGALYAGMDVDTARPIASVAKLFTAYAVLESPKKYESFTITESDVATEGRSGKLRAGEVMTPYGLLFPLLIESSNDAGTAIQRALEPTFLQSMYSLRDSLQLTDTNIVDSSGLSSKTVSSVRDLARFYSYVYTAVPHAIDITRLSYYISTSTGYYNNNTLHAEENFLGGKHGYTDEAGKTFVGMFTVPGTEQPIGLVLLKSDHLTDDVHHILSRVTVKEERIVEQLPYTTVVFGSPQL